MEERLGPSIFDGADLLVEEVVFESFLSLNLTLFYMYLAYLTFAKVCLERNLFVWGFPVEHSVLLQF